MYGNAEATWSKTDQKNWGGGGKDARILPLYIYIKKKALLVHLKMLEQST